MDDEFDEVEEYEDRERERDRERDQDRDRDLDRECERERDRDRVRERDDERLGGERVDCFVDDEGLSEFFNSSINVIDVVFNGRGLAKSNLFGSFNEVFDGSSEENK